jgi:hypothetical protein
MSIRLRGREITAREILDRARQASWRYIERAQLALASPRCEPAPGIGLARVLVAPGFALGDLGPAARSDLGRVLASARQNLDGRFDLLGLRNLTFGAPIDWHLEPTSGRRAPLTHWPAIDFLSAGVAGDKKVTWELNRHQFLMRLALAWRATGDPRFSRAVAEHVDAWIAANPPLLGINWASSLELAFRTMSWLWALSLLEDAPEIDDRFRARAIGSLLRHVRHIERYLSTYFSPNTHLTGEALALFLAGVCLPEAPHAARWRERGRRILLDQLPLHVRPDGTYFEQATWYHRYTVDFYLVFRIVADRAGTPVGEEVDGPLTALLDHLVWLQRPDGTFPCIGDDDGGRLLPVDGRSPADWRPALATAAALYGRGDYKLAAGDVGLETVLLLGNGAAQRFDALPAQAPTAVDRIFRNGGIAVSRSGWNAAADWGLLDCGPHGALSCGHSHSDALSFELAVGGRRVLVDPGTFTYTGSADWRDRFRSTAAHNTVTVDSQPQSEPGGPFRWVTRADATLDGWVSTQRWCLVQGRHRGYERFSDPVTHRRALLHLRDRCWLVWDAFDARGHHRYESRFHLAAGLEAIRRPTGEVQVADDRGTPLARFLTIGGGQQWRVEDDWISPAYGAREASKTLVLVFSASGPCERSVLILPMREEGSVSAATRLVGQGVVELTLEHGGNSETLVVDLRGGADPPIRDGSSRPAPCQRG